MKTKQTTKQNTSPRYLFLIQDGTEWTILAQTGRMGTKDQTKPRLKETQQGRHLGHSMAGWENRLGGAPSLWHSHSNAWPLSWASSAWCLQLSLVLGFPTSPGLHYNLGLTFRTLQTGALWVSLQGAWPCCTGPEGRVWLCLHVCESRYSGGGGWSAWLRLT